MYFFLLHLSLADILTAFFSLLPEILWTLTLPEFYGGSLLCRTMKFLQVGLINFTKLVKRTETILGSNLVPEFRYVARGDC
jgi:hypothetical protein